MVNFLNTYKLISKLNNDGMPIVNTCLEFLYNYLIFFKSFNELLAELENGKTFKTFS